MRNEQCTGKSTWCVLMDGNQKVFVCNGTNRLPILYWGGIDHGDGKSHL